MRCVYCIFLFLVAMILGGCRTKTSVVTVPEIHTEYIHRTDTVERSDTIIDRQTTVIREVDSAMMAQYGVQLENAQRVWLVEVNRLQREVERMSESRCDTVHVTDSVPYPVPVPKEVEKSLTWWQQTRLHAGELAIALLAGFIIYKIARR